LFTIKLTATAAAATIGGYTAGTAANVDEVALNCSIDLALVTFDTNTLILARTHTPTHTRWQTYLWKYLIIVAMPSRIPSLVRCVSLLAI